MTAAIEVLSREHEGAWDEFVSLQQAGFHAHRAGWRNVIAEEFGHDCHYLMARAADGSLQGLLPLVRIRSPLFGDYLVSVPYLNYGGPLGASAAVAEALRQHAIDLAASLGVSHAEFRDVEAGCALPERTDKVAMELRLPVSYDALMKQVGAKVRSQTRRPVREGATVEKGGPELLDDFYAVFSRNMRDLGTPVYARSFFRRIFETFPADCRLHVVRLGGRPVAAGFVIGDGRRLEIPWASSLREHNRLGVNMFLYAEVLRDAIERGFELFDFGRSTVDAGTYRFKAQWGAQPRQLYWHYWLRDGGELPGLTPGNPKYRLAIRLWQKLPVPVANLIGPHIVRGLP